MAAPALLNARPDKMLLIECRSAWGRMSQGPTRAGGLPSCRRHRARDAGESLHANLFASLLQIPILSLAHGE